MNEDKIILDGIELEKKYLYYKCYTEEPIMRVFEVSVDGVLRIATCGEDHSWKSESYEFNSVKEMLDIFKSLVQASDAFVRRSNSSMREDYA